MKVVYRQKERTAGTSKTGIPVQALVNHCIYLPKI